MIGLLAFSPKVHRFLTLWANCMAVNQADASRSFTKIPQYYRYVPCYTQLPVVMNSLIGGSLTEPPAFLIHNAYVNTL